MKDILVDNNIAKNFCNPLADEYKLFIRWLFEEGSLVVTQGLIREYISSCGAARSSTSIVVILHRQQIEGRLKVISAQALKAFKFQRRTERLLRSNLNDRVLIKAVMLSVRKYAVSRDRNFRHDINYFPGYHARAENRPGQIPYA